MGQVVYAVMVVVVVVVIVVAMMVVAVGDCFVEIDREVVRK